jgi:galactarate dehydratase
MDGNTTIAGGRFGRYGTADISDDVTQDAVLLFAQTLAKVIRKFQPASLSVTTREADSWLYVTQKGRAFVANRHMIMFWAVRDAADRNGFRLDVNPDDIDATPGAQLMRGMSHAEFLAVGTYLASINDVIFGLAWGDGQEFPVLRDVIDQASKADDIGRAGVLSHVAQKRHGGAYGSRRAVRRTRDAALTELRDLTERLDSTRETLAYHAARKTNRDA